MASGAELVRSIGTTVQQWYQAGMESLKKKFGREVSVQAIVINKMPSARQTFGRKGLERYTITTTTKPQFTFKTDTYDENPQHLMSVENFKERLAGRSDPGIKVLTKKLSQYHRLPKNTSKEKRLRMAFEVQMLATRYLKLGEDAKAKSPIWDTSANAVRKLKDSVKDECLRTGDEITTALTMRDHPDQQRYQHLENMMLKSVNTAATHLYAMGYENCMKVLSDYSNIHATSKVSVDLAERMGISLSDRMSDDECKEIITKARYSPMDTPVMRRRQVAAIIRRRCIGHTELNSASFQKLAVCSCREFMDGVGDMANIRQRMSKLVTTHGSARKTPEGMEMIKQIKAPEVKQSYSYKQVDGVLNLADNDPKGPQVSMIVALDAHYQGAEGEPEAKAMITLYDKVYNDIGGAWERELHNKTKDDSSTFVRRTMDTGKKERGDTVISCAAKITPQTMRDLLACQTKEAVEGVISSLGWKGVPYDHGAYPFVTAMRELYPTT